MKIIQSFAAALLVSAAMPSLVLAQGAGPIIELGGDVASGEGSGTAGLFLPFLLQNGDGLFVEGRGTFASGSVRQGSLGAGYRHRNSDGSIIGAYGYFDRLHSDYGNSFGQVSFGTEFIGSVFEARSNVYLPVTGSKTLSEFNRAYLSGDALVFQAGKERARKGVDAEAGIRLPVFPQDATSQLKLFGGGYWYEGTGMADTFGGKARAELTFAGLPGVGSGTTLALGASASYDNEDRLEFGVSARLRVALGGTSSGQSSVNPMYQRVERTDFIRTHAGTTGDREAVEFASSGEAIGKVVGISSASGTAAAINSALAAAGKHALVLASGDIALDNTLTLGSQQHLFGGGSVIGVRGVDSGGTALFRHDGAAATLTGSNPGRDVITMASGSEVANLTIRGGFAGIASHGAADLWIHNVDIAKAANDGIRLEDVAGATIQNASIHDLFICNNNTDCEFSVYSPNRAPYAAISALGTRNLTVRDTTISDVTYGVFAGSRINDKTWPAELVSPATNIVLDNVSISNSRREGVLLVAAKDIGMNKVTVDNSKQGLDMDLVVLQGTSNVSIADVTLKGGVNGLMLVSASTLPTKTTNVNVSGLVIDAPRNAGIFLNPVSDIHFKDVTISNAGSYGIFSYGSDFEFLGGPVKDITLNNVTIDRAAKAGLHFMGPSVNLDGNVGVTNTPRNCLVSSFGSYINGSLTQEGNSVLRLNGTALNGANFVSTCK